MDQYIFFNGQLIPDDEKLIGARNRGLRYGDGVFETMKVRDGKINLASYHFDRLFHGLQTLQVELPASFSPDWLTESVLSLCRKNNIEQAARVRMNVFRGDGSIYALEEMDPCITIEAEALPERYESFNETGLTVDIYKEVKKSCDILANLKSNNYLPSLMAVRYAQQQELSDCLLLNSYDRICEATIANIFWVKDKQIFTPPLSEGCVAGVMRRYLLHQLPETGYVVEEKICAKQKLLEADEIFLTNALYGIRWVQQFRTATFKNTLSAQLYKKFIKTRHTV